MSAQGPDLKSGPGFEALGLRLSEVAAYALASSAEGRSEASSQKAERLPGLSPEIWERQVKSVATDSRAVEPGAVFVALKGESRDGHAYIPKALEAGAMAVIAQEGHDGLRGLPDGAVIIKVADTTAALGQLAKSVRLRVDPLVAAVTGSAGKTTVKEFLRSIFEAAAGDSSKVLATSGNLNNHVGLPLTLLSMGPQTRLAAVEMGASNPGEIAYLTKIAKPDAGLVTMAGAAHLEYFGSLEGAAAAKGELYQGLSASSVAVVNCQDRLMTEEALRFPGNKLFFGLADPRQKGPEKIRGKGGALYPMVSASVVRDNGLSGQRITLKGPGLGSTGASLDLKLCGPHNALNASAAAAASIALGLGWREIAVGLSKTEPAEGRLRAKEGAGGILVIDDSYNANPESTEAALLFLKSLPAIRAAILGDMLELGRQSKELHQRVGRLAAESGLRRLALVGRLSRQIGEAAEEAGMDKDYIGYFDDPEEAARFAAKSLPAGSVVLVKGSRAMALEKAAGLLAP
ncbi:MAG: UDP-N-acetylmuramoyl-tripeptide--D-alanyl-D-alanine ligase [Deltaproteobacteria bacterium]|jgi:UDP-N-acetylmuramoyl-tripeptide--D-alanyl-D-alanine ligase|nr:UDP-N-acetylmuramoyl-tripeptide--D-alanyl-D-alanine ligase [Deltaproteobacteria bacterium]